KVGGYAHMRFAALHREAVENAKNDLFRFLFKAELPFVGQVSLQIRRVDTCELLTHKSDLLSVRKRNRVPVAHPTYTVSWKSDLYATNIALTVNLHGQVLL